MGEAEADPLTHSVIGAAIEVHKHLGLGLLESAYEECLAHELGLRGISCRRQVALPLEYKGKELNESYRMDLVVADCLVVEIKAIETVLPVHQAQLVSYLRLSGYEVGLLINFHTEILHKGVYRRIMTKRPLS